MDFPVAPYICGDATRILREMVSTGAQILELDYETNKEVAKSAMLGKTSFLVYNPDGTLKR
jgi:hypothetical protein